MAEIKQFFKHFEHERFIHITCSKFEARVKDKTEIEVNENDKKNEFDKWDSITKEKEEKRLKEKEYREQVTLKAYENYKERRKKYIAEF